MTEDETNIFIAKACGWTFDEQQELWRNPKGGVNDFPTNRVPFYTTDRNAMLEAVLSKKDVCTFIFRYLSAIYTLVDTDGSVGAMCSDDWKIHTAPTDKMAEAFVHAWEQLETINKNN